MATGAARPGAVAGHRQNAGCQWSQEGGFGVPRVAAPSAGRLGLVQSDFKGWASKGICWRCQANCSDIPWADTSSAAAWSRYRTSEVLARQTEQGTSVNPQFSFAWVFGRAFLHRCVALDGPGHDAGRDWKGVFRTGRRPGGGHKLFSISCVCVSACVCSSVLRVHVQLCLVSPEGLEFFRAQPRSGQIAELWNRIKFHCKTFQTQMPAAESAVGEGPRRPEASQAACEGCGEPATWCLAVSNWLWTSTNTSGQLTASLSVDSSSSCSACA